MNKRLLLSGFLIVFSNLAFAARYFVDRNSSCSSNCNGLSWEQAFNDLQDALAIAENNDEVWVAQGTYTPHAFDRNSYFEIPSGVTLYGGFEGNENTLGERDLNEFESILSGDLQGNDEENFTNYGDNSYTVVFTDGVSATTTVDGFTIRGGNANANSGSPHRRAGGGWFNTHYQGSSHPKIYNCRFEENRTTGGGGAFYNTGTNGANHPEFTHCYFINNQANTGGVIYNFGNENDCKARFIACWFERNTAIYTGGVAYNFGKNGGVVESVYGSCIFLENQADNAGTIYCLGDEGTVNTQMVNCTFYANYAEVGGIVYLNESSNGEVSMQLISSILWETQGSFDPYFHFSGNGTPQLLFEHNLMDANSCDGISETTEGLSCNHLLFNVDPLFADPMNKDFHLQSDSPAINAGDGDASSILSIELDEDFDGNERNLDQQVDMGAYEHAVGSIDLELDKSVDNITPTIGSDITFFIDLTNAGTTTATNVIVKDHLPDGLLFVESYGQGTYNPNTGEWMIDSIPANTSYSLIIAAKVQADGSICNLAQVIAADQEDTDSTPDNGVDTDGDGYCANDSGDEDDGDCVCLTLLTLPSIQLETRTNGLDANVSPGAIVQVSSSNVTFVEWEYELINDGLYDLSNLLVTDDQHGNVCLIPFLAAGDTVLCNLIGIGQLGHYKHEAQVSAQALDSQGNPFGNPISATDSTHYAGVRLLFEDTTSEEVLCANDTAQFSYQLSLLGGAPNLQLRNIQINNEDFNLSLPTNHTSLFISGDFNNNYYLDYSDLNQDGIVDEIFHLQFEQSIPESITTTSSIKVDFYGNYPNGIPELLDSRELSVTSEVDLVDYDLTIDLIPLMPNTLYGEDGVIEVQVTNTGNFPLSDLIVADHIANCTISIPALAVGATYTAQCIYPGLTANLEVEYTATAAAACDLNRTASTTLVVTPLIDLELNLSASNLAPSYGSMVVFTLEMSNQGPSDASAISVRYPLPSGYSFLNANGNYDLTNGIWTVDELLANESTTLILEVLLLETGEYEQYAEVIAAAGLDSDSTPDNGATTEEDDEASLNITPFASIDLSLEINSNDTPPFVGEVINLTYVINNDGPNTAQNVIVRDDFSNGLLFVDSSGDGVYDGSSNEWMIGTLTAGESQSLSLIALSFPNDDYTVSAEVLQADGLDVDSTPNNGFNTNEDDDAIHHLNILPLIDLEASQSVSSITPTKGSTVVFTYQVFNQGPSDANFIQVLLDWDGFEYVWDNSQGNFNPLAGLWSIDHLAANSFASFNMYLKVEELGNYTSLIEVFDAGETDSDSTPNNNTPNEDDQNTLVITPLTSNVIVGDHFNPMIGDDDLPLPYPIWNERDWITQKVQLYPNPAKDQLQILHLFVQDQDYTIYNSIGHLVQNGHLEQQKTINIQHLPAGVYYVTIGSYFRTPFIKVD